MNFMTEDIVEVDPKTETISCDGGEDGLRKRETYTFRSGIAAGVFATSSYAIVVWSMQFIEIAYVSSIREISIVSAAIIGMLFLFEKNAKSRIIPSILIVSGISVVYFQIL